MKVGYSQKRMAVVRSHHEGWRVYIIVTVSPFLLVCVYAWLLLALKVKLGLQFHWQVSFVLGHILYTHTHTSKQIHYTEHITIIYFYIQFQYPQLFLYQNTHNYSFINCPPFIWSHLCKLSNWEHSAMIIDSTTCSVGMIYVAQFWN